MNGMSPHSFSHMPVFSVKLCKFSSQALLPKKRAFGLGGMVPVWLHSAAIQFPHPGMKTSDTLGTERCSQSEPLLTPVVSSHDRKHSERATKNTRLSLHHVPKSCHLTTSPVFTLADLCKFVYGCIRTDPRRAGASKTTTNR